MVQAFDLVRSLELFSPSPSSSSSVTRRDLRAVVDNLLVKLEEKGTQLDINSSKALKRKGTGQRVRKRRCCGSCRSSGKKEKVDPPLKPTRRLAQWNEVIGGNGTSEFGLFLANNRTICKSAFTSIVHSVGAERQNELRLFDDDDDDEARVTAGTQSSKAHRRVVPAPAEVTDTTQGGNERDEQENEVEEVETSEM